MLAHSSIKEMMEDRDDPLIVTPLLDKTQIGPAYIDVRLGNEFIVWRRSSIECIDQRKPESEFGVALHSSQERVRVDFDDRFILHPGEFVVSSTLEYLAVPRHVAARMDGRSLNARVGLGGAATSTIPPGFRGCVQLDIRNFGGIPLVVRPGMLIASIAFRKIVGDPGEIQIRRSEAATGPMFLRNELPGSYDRMTGCL